MIAELSAVLGRAWTLYRAHFVALYTIGLTIWIPCLFFDSWFVSAKPFGSDFAVFPLNRPACNFIGVLAMCALFFYLREADAGRAVTPAEAVKASPRFWGPMVAAEILLAIVLAVGFLLLVVPGVYLMVRLIAVQPAIVGEDVGGGEAFRRSFELTKGKIWSVLLWIVAGMVPPLILGFVLAFPLALFLPMRDWISQAILATAFILPLAFIFPLVWVIYARLEHEEVR